LRYHIGKPGKKARHLRVSDAKPPLQNLTKAIGYLKCKARLRIGGLHLGKRRPLTGKPSAPFPTVPGGLCADCFRSRLRRLGFASPLGRDPSRTRSDYHDVESRPVKSETSHLHKTGTSHFALTHPSLALDMRMIFTYSLSHPSEWQPRVPGSGQLRPRHTAQLTL
jgi:hypothetical protein